MMDRKEHKMTKEIIEMDENGEGTKMKLGKETLLIYTHQ